MMIAHPSPVIPDVIRDGAPLSADASKAAPAPDQVRGDDNLEIA